MSIDLMMLPNDLIFCCPLLLLSIFPSIMVFSNASAFHIRWPKYWSFNFNISLPMNSQGWFPLRLNSLISLLSKRLSRLFSSITIESIIFFFFLVLRHLYGPALTFIYYFWKNHSFDYMDLCWQWYICFLYWLNIITSNCYTHILYFFLIQSSKIVHL